MDPKAKAASTTSVSKKKPRSQSKNFILTVIKMLIVFFVAVSCAAMGIAGGAMYGYIKTATPIQPDQLELKNVTSVIFDSKGKEVAQLKSAQNRILLEHDEIPDNLRKALVAIEDKRFYEHSGIDLVRISSAVISFLRPGETSHGGSTITQQLIKNLTGDTQRSLRRKVQEQWMAIQLEKHLSKDKILDLYMNLIYMGSNYYGVEAASKAYFNKSTKDLSLAECASIAGISNLPGRYAPFNEEGKKHNKERQEIILHEMKSMGAITQEEYDKAVKEELKFYEKDKNAQNISNAQNYFIDQVVMDIKKDLLAMGMSPSLADKTIYNNGLKIYTTMDSDIQKIMDDVYTDDKYFPVYNKKLEHPQSAMVIIDPMTGQVRGIRGGYGKKTGDLIFNRATSAQRQPGSSFKPIAVYAPAVDQKIITAATPIDDAPVYMNGINKGLYPQNYDKGYGGLTSIHNAIIHSINVVAAQVWLKMYNLDSNLTPKYLKRVGINRDEEKYVSVAMGGLHTGVNPLLMSAAYVPLANNGLYYEPITYTKVEDKDGNVIIEKKSKTTVAYDNEATSYVMTSMMKDVTKFGTASVEGLGQIQNGKMPSAGKTGTTSDNKDKWFVGFTPYYVGATWYGYDKSSKLDSREYNQALRIWHAVMEKVHEKLQPIDFQEPSGIVRKSVCIYSGKTPTDLCSRDPRGNAIREEVFIKGTEPKDEDVCDVHVLASVCKDSKDLFGRNLLFGSNCPQSSLFEQVFIQRKVPYSPIKPGDPYPDDWKYELPAGEYCNIHGSSSNPVNFDEENQLENQNDNDLEDIIDTNITLNDKKEAEDGSTKNNKWNKKRNKKSFFNDLE